MTGTAARPLSRAGTLRPGAARPDGAGARGARARVLRVVAPARSRARRTPFAAVVAVLLTVGLVGLVVMNTALQGQAFRLADLTSQASDLRVQQDQLELQAEQLQTPASVADAALRLGMVPNSSPVFLRLSDGAVIGVPVPAAPGTNVVGAGR